MNTDFPDYGEKVYRPFFDLSPRPLPQRFRVWVQAAEPNSFPLIQAGRLRELLSVFGTVSINALHKQLRSGELLELGLMYDWEIDELRGRFEKSGLSVTLRQEQVPDTAP